MRVVDLIIKKKQGYELTKDEIHYLINGFVNGEIPDYQMSALLMAICYEGLTDDELFALTYEMLKSGDEVDLSQINGLCVDKHSTGGVGDKTTLVISPICASFGLKLAKMSGRGLGHTGGTLDKLESIPGFKIGIPIDDFIKQVNEIGLAVVGQTANVAPADKKLYALRDVTGTVDSTGLIASSIMSKKLASGARIILLDVKVGDGAFMKTIEDAKVLAQKMVKIGTNFGRKVVAMITDMDEPLGNAIGNSLEVIEAIETLKGNGPSDFTKLCYSICAEMLKLAGIIQTTEEAYKAIDEKIKSGEALEKLKEMITYQHGDANCINNYKVFGEAKEVVSVKAKDTGYVKTINTLDLGVSAMLLGAGREEITDKIDPQVGIVFYPKKGDYITKGEVICKVYTNGKNTSEAVQMIQNAYTVVKEEIKKENIVKDIIGE